MSLCAEKRRLGLLLGSPRGITIAFALNGSPEKACMVLPSKQFAQVQMIDDLLDLSRISQGRMELQRVAWSRR